MPMPKGFPSLRNALFSRSSATPFRSTRSVDGDLARDGRRRRMGMLAYLLVALAVLVSAANAQALAIDPANSGIDSGTACDGTFCGLTPTYSLATVGAPITGDLSIVGSILSFTINLAAASFDAAGAGDGGVTALDLSDVVYSALSLNVTLDASDNYVVDGGQTASITGTVTPIGAGSPVPINASMALVTGSCSGTPGVALNCGLTFGPMLDFTAEINGNSRDFTNTLDVFTVVPEPTTALLLGAGLFALATRREATRA